MVAHWRYIEITFFIQGQAAGGVGLTCFVYISLLENQDLFTASDPVTVGLYEETNKGIKEKRYMQLSLCIVFQSGIKHILKRLA